MTTNTTDALRTIAQITLRHIHWLREHAHNDVLEIRRIAQEALAALSQQAAQEPQPVAWRYLTPTGWHATTDASKAVSVGAHHTVEPLYAAAPAKPAEQEKAELELALQQAKGDLKAAEFQRDLFAKELYALRAKVAEAEQQAPSTEQAPPLPEPAIVSYQTDATMRTMELHTYCKSQVQEYAEQYAAWKIAALRSEQALATEQAPESIGDRYAHRLAVMLECSLLDPNGTWNDAHKLLDEYRAEHERIYPSPPTCMGEPLIAATAPRPGNVDWKGLALDLEQQAKRVDSQAPAGEVPSDAHAALKLMDDVDDLIRWASVNAPAHLYNVSSRSFWKVCHMLAALSTPPAVPQSVLQAVERMSSPLHESRLAGVTAAEDARCMKIISDFIGSLSAAPAAPQGEQP